MKPLLRSTAISVMLFISFTNNAQQIDYQQKKQTPMKQVLIDKLTVPVNSKEAFIIRMNTNREMIKNQPGFIKDEVFEQDNGSELIFITIAIWSDQESLNNAREMVTKEYTRTGFDMKEFCREFNIHIDRGIFHLLED
jgi:heme-degrading monooxygenase HmoA